LKEQPIINDSKLSIDIVAHRQSSPRFYTYEQSDASNVYDVCPIDATSKPSAITPRNSGLCRGCGGLIKSSIMWLMAILDLYQREPELQKQTHRVSKISALDDRFRSVSEEIRLDVHVHLSLT